MLNIDQLKAGINNGDLESVYSDCRRYGILISSVNYDWPCGVVTERTIKYLGKTFKFTLHLGMVVSASFY